MIKEIVILQSGESPSGMLAARVLFRIPVAVGNEIPVLNGRSEYRDFIAQNNTDTDGAIAAGTIVEEAYRFRFPKSMSGADVQSLLVSAYNDRVAARGAEASPGQYFGRYYEDGTGWANP